jgi:hypothetical protein
VLRGIGRTSAFGQLEAFTPPIPSDMLPNSFSWREIEK